MVSEKKVINYMDKMLDDEDTPLECKEACIQIKQWLKDKMYLESENTRLKQQIADYEFHLKIKSIAEKGCNDWIGCQEKMIKNMKKNFGCTIACCLILIFILASMLIKG